MRHGYFSPSTQSATSGWACHGLCARWWCQPRAWCPRPRCLAPGRCRSRQAARPGRPPAATAGWPRRGACRPAPGHPASCACVIMTVVWGCLRTCWRPPRPWLCRPCSPDTGLASARRPGPGGGPGAPSPAGHHHHRRFQYTARSGDWWHNKYIIQYLLLDTSQHYIASPHDVKVSESPRLRICGVWPAMAGTRAMLLRHSWWQSQDRVAANLVEFLNY